MDNAQPDVIRINDADYPQETGMSAIDRAVEYARDRDWEAHHGSDEPEAPFAHTRESWSDAIASELLGDDDVVEKLREELSRVLQWLELASEETNPRHLFGTSNLIQIYKGNIGELIVRAALKSGLTSAKMGVIE